MSHDDQRRARFLEWFRAHMGEGPDARAKFMRRTGYTKGRVSQLFNPAEPFGERVAAAIAERLGIPPDSFFTGSSLEPQPVKTSGEPLVLTSEEVRFAYDRLGGTEKAVFCDLLRAVGRLSDPLGQLIERDGTWQNEKQTVRAEEEPPVLKESRALR